MKRILSFVLCLSMLLSMLPVSAFASDVEETVVTETVPAAETTQAPETQEPTQTPVIETTAAPETEAAETTASTEAAAEETTAETTVPGETTVPVETIAPTVAQETEPQETEAEELTWEYTYIPDEAFPDSDALFAAYVEQQFYGTEIATFGTAAGERLTGDTRDYYDKLVPAIQEIANGSRSSSRITIAVNSYDFDIDALLSALLSDLPYDLYWFDKVSGISCSGSNRNMTFEFYVAANYSVSGSIGTCDVDTAKTGSVTTAVANAQAIVEKYASETDYNKLLNYKNEICSLTSYNTSAASSGNFSSNDDPWQLIYVFDGLQSTKVVCEGYSKAFQYLCDLSDFSADVTCYNVSGIMSGGTGAGPHMWNIVSINGKNYLVDVTNSDAGTVGANGKLFMAGKAPNSDGSYTIGGVKFTYNSETTALWGTGEDSILNLATENFDPDSAALPPSNSTAPMTGQELLAALEGVSGPYNLEGPVTIDSPITLPSGVYLQLPSDAASITVTAGGSLTVSQFLGVTNGAAVIVEEGASLILNGTLSVGGGGSVDVYGTLEHNARIESAGVVTVHGGYIPGDNASTQLIGNGVILLTAEDRFQHAINSAEPGSEVIIWDHIVVTEDLTIQVNGMLSFADYSSLTVTNGATLTLNCPVNINGAQLYVDQGAKLISNVDLTINNPQSNGGSAVFNGEFENNGSFWVNTGSTADINSYAYSSGPIFVGFGGNSRLHINGQLDTCAYMAVNEGGSLHLSEGAKLNLLGQGGGYLDNAGYCYLGGDVYVEFMMTSGARRDEETGEVVGDEATIEIRGSVTGTDTSTIGVGEGGSIQCFGTVTTAGEVVVEPNGAFWVDNTVTLSGPAPLTVNGWLHIDYFDEYADADGLLNLETTANVHGYLHVCDGGNLNVTDKAVLNILNDKNGCGYLDNQGHVGLHGTMNLDGLFTTGPAVDENGNVVGGPADTELRGSISASDRSFIGVGTQGSLNCFGPVTTAGEVTIDPEGALWVDNTVSITGPGALRNNGYLHIDFFDEFATADGVLNVDTETHVNGYLHVCDGGSLHMGENSTLGIYNNENSCGYLDNQGTAVMDGHLYLEGLFTTGAACDENGNVVGEPASAQFNWYVDTTETSSFGVLKDGTVTLFGVNNAGEFRTEDGGRLIFPENVSLENHGGMVAMAEDTMQFEGFGLVLNHMIDGALGSVSGVPYEHLCADVHAYNADQVYRLFEIASPEEYSDITVIVEDSMVLDRDLTIPEVGFINIVAWEVPFTTVTIPEGVTVTNNGYIYVLENTKLVIDGVLDGNPPENMGGTITGGNAELTAEKLEQQLIQKGHVDLRTRLVLTRDLTIPGGTVLNITEGGQLVVPGGKKLIVEGELHVTNSVDKEGNGKAGLLLESGALLNNGLIAIHDLGLVDASNGVYEQAEWAHLDLVYLGDDNDSQIPFAPSEAIGIPLNCITLIADYTNPEVIRVVLRIAEGAAADNNPFGHVRINIGRDMTLSEDMTIPGNGYLYIENCTVSVPAGFTLTNEGRIEIGWNGRLVVEGTLEGYQPMVINGGEYINAAAYTEDDLRADIEKAAREGREFFLSRAITLTEDLLIPEGAQLTIADGGRLAVPTSVTLTVEGSVHVTWSLDAQTNLTNGLILEGGHLANYGTIVTRDYGFLNAANGTYEQADWAQLHRVYYSPDNGGDVFPSEVSGISGAYVDLIFDNVDGEVLPNLLKIPDQMLNNGDPFRSVQINITGWERRQYVDLTIPAYAWMRVSDGGTLVIPSGVTVYNNGNIDIYPGGTVIVEEGGAIVGSHPACVEPGATYINHNTYGQDHLEELIAQGQANGTGRAVLGVPVTLTRDLTIPAGFILIISGENHFLTISEGITLTNEGRIVCDTLGGILAQGGTLRNAGDVHAIYEGIVDMSQGVYEKVGEGMVYNAHISDPNGNIFHATVLVPPEHMTIVAETFGDDGIIREMIAYADSMIADGNAPYALNLSFAGNAYLTGDLELPAYSSPVIPYMCTLTVPEGCTLYDNVGLLVEGQLIIEGNAVSMRWPMAANEVNAIINPTSDTRYYVFGTPIDDYTIGCDSTAVSVGGGVELRIENVEPAYAEYYGLYDLEILSGEGWIDGHTVRSNTPGTVTVAVKPVVGHDAENGYAPIYSENIKTIDISFMEATAEAWWDCDFFQDEVYGVGTYAGSKFTMGGMLFDHTNLEELEGTARLEIQGANEFVTIKENANGTVTISSNKNMTEAVVLTVTSIPVETHGLDVAATTHYMVIRPRISKADLLLDGETVTGKTITVDVNRGDLVRQLTGLVDPAEAIPAGGVDAGPMVQWKSSNTKVATVDENGLVTFTGAAGTAKITMTANYGAKKTATVTFKTVALAQEILPGANLTTELIGGKAATYSVTDGSGNALAAKAVEWYLVDEQGNPMASNPYASINAKGKLTTKAVADPYEIYIMAKVIGTEDGATLAEPIAVTLYPAVTSASIRMGEPGGYIANGKTLRLDTSLYSSMQLFADVAPCAESVKSISWKSSKSAVAEIDETGLLTLTGAGKTKITLTVVALDGKKTTATCEFSVGAFVRDITVTARMGETVLDDLVIYSGESITFSATTKPANPTTAGVKWSIPASDKAYASISGKGVLKAKTVSNPVTITVIVESKDGNYINDIPVTIVPKPVQVDGEAKEPLLIQNDWGEFITKTTVTMAPGTDSWLYATDEAESWKSSKSTVADIDDNGHLVAKANGTAKITVTATDGRTAEVTVKVSKIAEHVEISTLKNAPLTVASGKSLGLAAKVTYSDGSTDKKVTWSLDWNDCGAKISGSGKVTAPKGLTEAATVAAVATSKDGYVTDYVIIEIVPAATGVEIYGPFHAADSYDVDISNTTQKWDLTTQGSTFYLYAGVFPNSGMQDVTWKSSSAKVASVDADGRVTCLKSGTATITATAADGSGKKASFKLTVVKTMAFLELPGEASVVGGKSLTLTKEDGYAIDTQATNKTLTWTMTDLDGNAVPKTVATLSNKGVLKTKAVKAPVQILVRAESTDGSGLIAECVVTINPKA